MKQIYLDNAATTPLAPEVAEAIVPVLTDVYETHRQAMQQEERQRL